MFLVFHKSSLHSPCLLVPPKTNLLHLLCPHHTRLSDLSPSRLQCSFWNRPSMFPGEKRAATLFRFRRNILTHFCVPIAKTPCPSLILQSCPARLQPTPTPDRYQGRIFEVQDRPSRSRLSKRVFLQNQRRASIGARSSSSPRTRTRSPSRGRGGQSDTEERHRQPRGRQG